MFLAWLHCGSCGEAARVEAEVAEALAAGWRLQASRPGVSIATTGPRPPQVREIGDGFVVGELFHSCTPMREAPGALPYGRETPEGCARQLLQRYWGRYVALLRAPENRNWSVLRDPSGAREALTWRLDGVWRVASTLVLPATLRPRIKVDWSALAGVLVDPVQISGELALEGVAALAPGELRSLRPSGDAGRLVWSPVERAHTAGINPASARARVRDAVVASTRSLARPLAEVSGGFDSSVVAAMLVDARGADAIAWVHHVVEEAEADERVFARATARRLGLTLSERVKPEARLDPADLVGLRDLPRPSLNATDTEYERAMIDGARQAGGDGFVTGQGGDAIFLTLRSAWLGADLLHRRGAAAVLDGELQDLARSARRSVWTLVRRAALSRLGWAGPKRRTGSPFVSAQAHKTARGARRHPWLAGVAALPPGKRIQIEALTEALVVQAECARSRAAPLVHPLMSQPVMELCLPVPANILAYRGRDRAWAREMFAQDLAPEVAARRTKGDMTAYYGRMVAAGLPQLRPFLLDGQLMAHGLLDFAKLSRALDVERLAVDGLYADLMDLVAIEAWTRTWPG